MCLINVSLTFDPVMTRQVHAEVEFELLEGAVLAVEMLNGTLLHTRHILKVWIYPSLVFCLSTSLTLSTFRSLLTPSMYLSGFSTSLFSLSVSLNLYCFLPCLSVCLFHTLSVSPLTLPLCPFFHILILISPSDLWFQ